MGWPGFWVEDMQQDTATERVRVCAPNPKAQLTNFHAQLPVWVSFCASLR
jgi:hypothetical protein